VEVESVRAIHGQKIRKAAIAFNNRPLTCGWQTFHVGQRVYVFIDPEISWAAAASDVSFDRSRH